MLGIPEADQDRLHATLERLFPFSSGAGPGLNEAVVLHLEEKRYSLHDIFSVVVRSHLMCRTFMSA